MRTETACRMRCLLKRTGGSPTSLKEHLFVSYIILMGRVLCKVTPAMPTWGLSPDPEHPDPGHRQPLCPPETRAGCRNGKEAQCLDFCEIPSRCRAKRAHHKKFSDFYLNAKAGI